MKVDYNKYQLSKVLISWYELNKRELPWRETSDPYKIWLSEIILQQTRVVQGLHYYLRFVERFPTVKHLADASEDEVLKYWQGLGYYSRARNLHKAANQICNQFDAVFPVQHSDVIKLAGIGDYTAAAICSFAYNQPYAVVDGNVYRVLSRLFGVETPIDSTEGKKLFAALAQEILSAPHAATHNQAIMEFGALLCTPMSPDCVKCPLSVQCVAFKSDLIGQLPVKEKKTKVTERYFNYFYVLYKGKTFLQKRIAKDVWQNLYEFPLIETSEQISSDALMQLPAAVDLFAGIKRVELRTVTKPMKHVLSHRIIYAQFVTVEINELNDRFGNFEMVTSTELDDYAVSRLTELFLESL
ncbi:MAG: hypothetical protein RIS29_557 [Bacteroidota bacterium]|jgi:A/G-specific adenine glycosylase